MTSKEKQNENLYGWISGIFGQISNGYPLQRSDHGYPLQCYADKPIWHKMNVK
jgi:hypothetical protein